MVNKGEYRRGSGGEARHVPRAGRAGLDPAAGLPDAADAAQSRHVYRLARQRDALVATAAGELAVCWQKLKK